MTRPRKISEIVEGVKARNKRLTGELMSLIEQEDPFGEACLRQLKATANRAYILGVTGWPGVGKSTIVARLARHYLHQNRNVGIIAIDPSSPFSGGSLLGDRERMKDIEGHENLFIRSASTRGHPGGISRCTRAFTKVMEAMGKGVVIIETVGVGQDQVSIIQMAHTILLVLIPGMGDYLQSLKAGVLEIGDIFVVNKADRQGVNQTMADLQMMISMNRTAGEWTPPIVKTIATCGTGIGELIEKISLHRTKLGRRASVSLRQTSAAKSEIIENITSRCLQHIATRVDLQKLIEVKAQNICDGTSDPFVAAEEILKESGII